MEEQLIPIGMLIIFIGFLIVMIGSILTALKGRSKTEGGFVFWIGPIPIIGATSKQMFYTVLLISLIFLFLLILLNVMGK